MSRRSKGGGAASVAGRASALSKNAMMFDQPSAPNSPSPFHTPVTKEDNKPPPLSQQDLLATLDTNSVSWNKLVNEPCSALKILHMHTNIVVVGIPSATITILFELLLTAQ